MMASRSQIEAALYVVETSKKAVGITSSLQSKADPQTFEIDPFVFKVRTVISKALVAINADQKAPADTGAAGKVQEIPTCDHLVRKANLIVTQTIRAYTDWSAQRLAEAEVHLRPYEGLPVQFDILSLMNIDDNEAVFCQLLSWLLKPEGSHGLGDAFLRLFLARLGISGNGRVFDFSKPLKAEVTTEVSWDVPKEEYFFTEDYSDANEVVKNARRLRVDILLIIQGYVIPIEAKVYAKESLYQFRGEKWAQAALYGRMWQLMLHARADPSNLSGKESDPFIHWEQTLRKCVDATPALYDKLHFLDNGRAEVVPVLIHPRGQCRTKSQPMGKRQHEHGLPVWHMRWLDIDRILYRLCCDRDLQAGRLDLIRSFRTTILRLGASANLVTKIEDLRLRMAEPALTRRFPIESSASLRLALADLTQVDTCCAITNDANKRGISNG